MGWSGDLSGPHTGGVHCAATLDNNLVLLLWLGAHQSAGGALRVSDVEQTEFRQIGWEQD